MTELYEIERHHTVKWKKFTLAAGADQALLAAPQSRDDNGDLAVDPETEYVVVRTEWSSAIPGTFVLRDGSTDLEGVRNFSGNAGDKEDVRIEVGKGKALTITTTLVTALELRIGYYVQKYSQSRSVTA